MAECSQEFKNMLNEYGGDCRSYGYNDGCVPEPSEAAILQYVAELEAAKRSLVALGYTYHGGEMWKPPLGKVPLWVSNVEATNMTGGMP